MIEDLWARNFQTNGFFVHSDNGTTNCNGFLMKNDLASFNRSYGLFAKRCIGGRITQSKGWGHGDSAIYIGETPPQTKPKWTQIDHDLRLRERARLLGHQLQVRDIHDSDFFNNGAGIVPNTLDSEAFQPNANGKIRDNDIFWNNFNYFLPNSPVETVSGGLGQIGDLTINYPTGVGVVLFGSRRLDGQGQQDLRQLHVGRRRASRTRSTPAAVNQNNRFIDNEMGRNGTDTNRFDFFNDGSGKGTCFSGNSSSTLRRRPGTPATRRRFLYPTCPAPNIGTGTNPGDGAIPDRSASWPATCSAARRARRRTPGCSTPIRRSRG